MIKAEQLYTEKEIIRLINKQFGENTLNRPMLAYMRDIRKLIPKPIRKHFGSSRHGGAFSYYTEDSLQLLQSIFKEKISNGKNLKEIEEILRDTIEQVMFKTDLYRENIKNSLEEIRKIGEYIRQSAAPLFEAVKRLKEYAPNVIHAVYIEQLEETLNAFRRKDDKQIDEALNNLSVMTKHIQKCRLKNKIVTQKGEEEKKKAE